MFQNLYKHNIDKYKRQEIRRNRLLQKQKLKRLEQQDGFRNHVKVPEHCGKVKSFCEKYTDTNIENIHLQLSEWFKETPENFDDWLLVPCPIGQRCLVVAQKGKTKMYSKTKRCRMTCLSLLPGGGLIGSDKDHCILDCIYYQEKDTFYVLDALHFSIPLVDCDAEFRFFWLKSKFIELEDLEDKYKSADVKSFQLIDNYDISNESRLSTVLQRYPLWQNNQPKLDGFLFYHKKSHYVFGTTPLVCWLFPFMLPDILRLTVSSVYETPAKYCKQNPWQYMDQFDEEMSRKRNKKTKNKTNSNLSTMEDVESAEEHLDGSVDKNYLLESLLVAERKLEMGEFC